jgi:hypothetical protein
MLFSVSQRTNYVLKQMQPVSALWASNYCSFRESCKIRNTFFIKCLNALFVSKAWSVLIVNKVWNALMVDKCEVS